MENVKHIVLVDNGHGRETAGKRSPDGLLCEWEWTRRAAAALVERLRAMGVDARRLVEEDADVALAERVRRANAVAGTRLLVSLHVNAAGDGSGWKSARGFSAWVAPNASQGSRLAARLLTERMAAAGLAGNRATPPCGYNTASFLILRRTAMPAVLTECLFMDNRSDCALLRSSKGFDALVRGHADAIVQFLARR